MAKEIGVSSGAQFEGKTALVTGAGSGIGEAIALALAARGARLVIADLNLEAAQRVAKAIGGEGGVAAAVQANVADLSSVEAMVQFAADTYGGLAVAGN